MYDGTFTLLIELGNEEMCEKEHIAAALRKIANKLENGVLGDGIADANGNSVGRYDLVEKPVCATI